MTICERSRFADAQIDMAHGAGGKASRRLIEGLIVPLARRARAARPTPRICSVGDARLAITTDSFVVRPLRFPGGSIGDLAVNGTVNDLAVGGARAAGAGLQPHRRSGDADGDASMPRCRRSATAARRAGVPIVGGDTKVVEHGKADGLYITTTGIGRVDRACGAVGVGGAAGRSRAASRATSAITASPSCSRAATSIWTPRCSPTRARC